MAAQREDVRNALKQLGREWSAAGDGERAQIHTPLLDALQRYCPCPAPRAKLSAGTGGESAASSPDTDEMGAATPLFPRLPHAICLRPRPFAVDTEDDAAAVGGGTGGGGEKSASVRGAAAAPLVLVPGAALGRLAVDIGSHGYRVQACECTAAMAAVAASLLAHRPLGKGWQYGKDGWLSVAAPAATAAAAAVLLFTISHVRSR